jgi:hypothetical protein
LISTLPAGVLGGAGTILYGLIAVLGGRIWVENRVNFNNPVNLIPCAIGLIAGAGNYTLIFDHGNVSFNGIAMGCFGTIIAFQLMRWLSRYGVFHDGQPSAFATIVEATSPSAKEKGSPVYANTGLSQPMGAGVQPNDPPMGSPPIQS